jgi:ATP/maltotriose-dependent transcriptional regulator MalT
MDEGEEGEAAAREAMRVSKQLYGNSIAPASRLSAWYAGRGELEQARSLLSQARGEAAAGQPNSREAAWLSRAEAHLAAAEGRWPAALAAFEVATGEWRRIGARWYAAWFKGEWAEALLARGEPGDREQAVSLLGQAAAEFDAIGAPYYVEQAKRRISEQRPELLE